MVNCNTCCNRPRRSHLEGHQFIFYCHAFFLEVSVTIANILTFIIGIHCQYKNSINTPTATKHALHVNFTYVHEKVISLGKSRLRALVVLILCKFKTRLSQLSMCGKRPGLYVSKRHQRGSNRRPLYRQSRAVGS